MINHKQEGLNNLARAKEYIADMNGLLKKSHQKQKLNKTLDRIEDSIDWALQNFKFIEGKEIFKFSIGAITGLAEEDETLTHLVIPAEIDGEAVTLIGCGAFKECKFLKSVIIPDTVTSIGIEAFYGCKSITDITIPEGVKTIGSFAFYNCTSLTSVTIPDSVIRVNAQAFQNCASLKSVIIGNKISWFDSNVFHGCTSLETITIRRK